MKKYLLLAALSFGLVVQGDVRPAGRGRTGPRHAKAKHARGVRHLGSKAHFQKLVRESKGGKPLVVKFFATWCSTCTAMAPHFRATKNQFMQDAQFVKVNIDRFKGLSRDYAVKGVPTLVVIKNGEEVDRAIGGMDAGDLNEWVKVRVGGTGVRLAADRARKKTMKMGKLCRCGSGKTVKDCGCKKGKMGLMKGKICPCGSAMKFKECCGKKGKRQLHKRG